ncbi:hypothetical protein [Klenkia taihuensis]|uniref:Mce-associated membrane protein n=1 Tax=Klenkia taihuensis TaxID=1225127 RepID=A0A1I1JH18_9ACTN|nr:hypothetical protein [Klenkia taihuensis]GHE10914.1 hypothetical protein GCM10011381_22190 [Klenkia taihuensis]SFC47451.1 hypothetical protein SAMN05661030_1062 [Klenkia taihuensis]
MTDTPDGTDGGTRPRPRPTPRPRTGAARPSPRPRVAGSRRAEDDATDTTVPTDATPTAEAGTVADAPAGRRRPSPRTRAAEPAPLPKARPRPAARAATAVADPPADTDTDAERPGRRRRGRGSRARSGAVPRTAGRTATGGPGRSRTLALVLAVLCVLTAAGGGWLLWQRSHPTSVDPAIFAAARSGVEDVYAYDYRDSDGSVQRKLDALTGDLRDQYEADLSSGGIIDTYEQVSATTSYDVLEVGLQQVNASQDQATLVVFGQYVVESVNSGTQTPPAGSECTVTDDGAQSCTQTVRVTVLETDDGWKISELTLLTSS